MCTHSDWYIFDTSNNFMFIPRMHVSWKVKKILYVVYDCSLFILFAETFGNLLLLYAKYQVGNCKLCSHLRDCFMWLLSPWYPESSFPLTNSQETSYPGKMEFEFRKYQPGWIAHAKLSNAWQTNFSIFYFRPIWLFLSSVKIDPVTELSRVTRFVKPAQ